MELSRFRLPDLVALLVIVAVGGSARAWYLMACADHGRVPGPLQVQGAGAAPAVPAAADGRQRETAGDLNTLIGNLRDKKWFGSTAPLADKEEETAHRAPGYPWLVASVGRWLDEPERIVRWAQAVLGALTAACYFLFARRAFRSTAAAVLAGLLCALNPFWIINTAEINDGVLATFLVAAGIALGTRAAQEGGAFSSVLFGLTMAGVCMVRAALLPFATVSVLWFLLHCRKLDKGWFAALLAFLGFANGLVPWTVRNFQAFGEPVPVADSAGWHLWMGNNPEATGGPLDEATLRKVLGEGRVKELTAEQSQARRYARLSSDVAEEVSNDPGNTLVRRMWAGLYFLFGEDWFEKHSLVRVSDGQLPAWLEKCYPGVLAGTLLGMLLLGGLGWRWSFGWRRQARLATLAVIWLPFPYLLSHADYLSGPRLPLDGVLICYGAFVLAYLVPGVGGALRQGPDRVKKETS